MEVVFRATIFHVLDNTFNDILHGRPHPNSYSSATNQSDFCLAEKMCPNSVNINLLNLFIVSSCMVLVVSSLKNVLGHILKWLTLLLLLSTFYYYFGDYSSVILSNPSVMALRVTICGIVFYFLFRQLDSWDRRELVVLKYLIPITFWLWTLHYVYDECNVVLSHHVSLMLRIATFLIASFAVFMIRREITYNSRAIPVAICFLLFTFGSRTAEFQRGKYVRLISLMRKMLQKNGETEFGELTYFLIDLTCFVIQPVSTYLYNYCFSGTFRDLIEWNSLREIDVTESITIVRYLIIWKLLSFFDELILNTVQCKLLQTSALEETSAVIVDSPSKFVIFAVDSQIWNSNAESRWNMLTMCFLIHCGAILSNICHLVGNQEGKKRHYTTLGLSLFTFIGAVILLFLSVMTVSLGPLLFIAQSLSIYVIAVMPLAVLEYLFEDVGPYNENVEAPHYVILCQIIQVGLKYFLMLSLIVTLYSMAMHEGFGLLLFTGAMLFWSKLHNGIQSNYALLVNYWRAWTFIYFVREPKPKKLEEMCSICREEMVSSNCVTTCRHHYHKYCLLSWLYRSNTCPMCNSEIYDQYPY